MNQLRSLCADAFRSSLFIASHTSYSCSSVLVTKTTILGAVPEISSSTHLIAFFRPRLRRRSANLRFRKVHLGVLLHELLEDIVLLLIVARRLAHGFLVLIIHHPTSFTPRGQQ